MSERNERAGIALKLRKSWDGLRCDGEHGEHRFSASYYAKDPHHPANGGYWLMWHYAPGMPLDAQGFAIHPTIAPNGWPCTGLYRDFDAVQDAIRAIVASIDNPNVIAFRPRAFQAKHTANGTGDPLVA